MSTKNWRRWGIRGLIYASSLCAVGTAHAQSSVLLYGLADVQITHRTGGPGGTQTSMAEGALTGSRWGLKGVEDLGNGWQAIFDLENGFAIFNGRLDQQGQLFGRQAWVGLAQTRGSVVNTLTFGRQYTVPFIVLSNFDPLTWSNDPYLAMPVSVFGARADNTIYYSFATPAFNAVLEYTVGGQAGDVTSGAIEAAGATYAVGLLQAGFALEHMKDAKGDAMTSAGFGLNAQIGNAKLFALYEVANRDPGFTPGASATSAPLANLSVLSNAGNSATRRDAIEDVGVSYLFQPDIQGVAGLMHDEVSGVHGGARGGDTTIYGVFYYLLSKRTTLYSQINYSRLVGAEVSDPAAPSGALGGGHSSTEIGVGMRAKF